MRQQVQFCTSFDGTRIAYAITGAGTPLVRAPHWFSHLEHDWPNPAFRPWVEDLSKRYSFLRFDQRGCGLSDREVRRFRSRPTCTTWRAWSTQPAWIASRSSASRRARPSPSPMRRATPSA